VSPTAGELSFGLDAGLWDVMATMRAMRRLKPDPVPPQLLEQLVQAATWAPSGANEQGQHWLIVTDRSAIAAVEPIWSKSLDLYWATVGSEPAETMNATQHAALRRAVEYQRDHFAEIPALLVACYGTKPPLRRLLGNWRGVARILAAQGPRDAAAAITGSHRVIEMGEAASVYPAVQNLLLTARALGLGATLTTLHLSFERQFKQALGIPSNVKTFAVVPVGYPRGRFGPVRRKPAAQVTHWDRF